MKTKRVPISQAMTASVGEKRKRLGGKVTEEPPMIPCTTEELNHILDKWIGDGVVRPFTMSRPSTEAERKNLLFCRIQNYVKHSTKDCWTLWRLFHKKLREGTLKLTQREPKVQRKCQTNPSIQTQLGPFRRTPGSGPCSTSWNLDQRQEGSQQNPL